MGRDSQGTILIIDDEPFIRESYADYLEDRNFRVLTAENGRVGLELLEREKPDLILTDLRMPEVNGLEVLQRARELCPDIPLIVVSGTGQISDSIQALRLGAWDYILKPVEDMSIFVHAVSRSLEKARLLRENRKYQENLESLVFERTRELEEASERQRMILDALRIGVVVLDPLTRRVVESNSEAASLIGLLPEQLVGSECLLFSSCAGGDPCKPADPAGAVNNIEDTLCKADGSRLPVLRTVVPIQLNGRLHLLESFIDISRRKEVEREKEQLESQLARAQKMEAVGTLAGGLAHDLNNALNGIFGPASILLNRLALGKELPEEQLLKQLNRIQQSGYRISDMVSQLMAVASRQELSIVAVDLNLSLKHVVKIAQNTFDKSIEILPAYFPEPARTAADPTQIEQVLLNLAINSSHAMTIMRPPQESWGGRLEMVIGFTRADERILQLHPDAIAEKYWKISVSDTGVGMSEKELAQVFTPFFTTKEKGYGTGLGLTMVYSIVKQHEGFIEIESQPAAGTRFTVYLPVLPFEGGRELMPDRPDGVEKGEGLVLIVDDEEISRITAEEILKECGYETITAENGLEALAVFEKRHQEIRLVLLDLVMPKISAKETYRKLAAVQPDVKVVLVSGFKSDERVDALLKLGKIGFIQKPYEIRRFSKAVKEFIS